MKKNNFSILKLFIFLLFFLLILTMFMIVYIIPVMKEYKTNESVLKKYEKLYKKEKEKINYLKRKEDLLKDKYKISIKKYENDFNEDDFKKFLSKYLSDVKIKKTVDKNNTKYHIQANTNEIENFLNMVEKLNNYKNIVKVLFPIDIKREEKSYNIAFYITILNTTLKNNL